MEKFNYKKWILAQKEILSERIKPGSEKKEKLPDGRAITRYTTISKKGRETPMVSYDDNLEGPGDTKDLNPPTNKKSNDQDKTDTTGAPKKYPFIGPKDKEFEVKLFDISPEAIKLYTELQNITFKDNPEMLDKLRSSAIQHERLFIIEKKALDSKSASKAQIKCAEDIISIIQKFAREMGKESEHNYLQARIDSIKKIHQEKPREDKGDDCPDAKDIENNKDDYRQKFRLSKQSTTYGPSNPAPRYSEGISSESLKERIKELSLDDKVKLYFMGLVRKGIIDTLPEDPKAAYIRDMMSKKDPKMDSAVRSDFDDPTFENLKEISTELGYLNESRDNITLHTDEGLYQEEKSNLEDLKSYPFPLGAEITVPALGSAKFANNIETREKTKNPNASFGIDYYLNEFEKEYGPTEFEISKEFSRYTITPIDNPNFTAAYERDRQKQIDRRKNGSGFQRRDNMGNKTSKWS